jgi:hypothetical protein
MECTSFIVMFMMMFVGLYGLNDLFGLVDSATMQHCCSAGAPVLGCTIFSMESRVMHAVQAVGHVEIKAAAGTRVLQA